MGGPSTRRGRRAVSAVAGLLAACAAAVDPGVARGDGLSGRGIVSYQGQDATTQDSTSVKQLYELRMQRHVSLPLEYRLRLRYEDDRGEARTRALRSDLANRQLQPAAELLFAMGAVQVQSGYDYTWLDTAGSSNERELRRAFARAQLQPADLPAVLVDAEQRAARDAGASLDQVDTSAGVALDYGIDRWRFRETNRFSRFEDRISGFERQQLSMQGMVSYETAPSQKRVGANASVTASALRRAESFLGSSGGEVPREIAAARGLYAFDDSPPDSSDRPLASLTALVDGNLAASAGISVGPDGLSFQNVGVDMGRFLELDELRVYVRDRDGNALPADGLVTWVVYTSADGVSWIPAQASRSSYFPPLGYYEVRFDRATARFFKAVSFGVNTRESFVTEVQPVVHEAFRPREERSTWDVLGALTGQVRYHATERTDLTYSGVANVSRQSSGGGQAAFDWDQAVGAAHRPHRVLSLEGRVQDRRVFTPGSRATANTVLGVARVTPLPALQHELGAGFGTERATARSVDTTYATLRNLARLYPTLDVTLDGGYTSQRDRLAGRRGFQYSAGAGALARVTPNLTLTLAAGWSRARQTVAPILVGRNDRYSAQVDWRASARLGLSGRLGWVDATGTSGLLQQYRVFWNPFSRGTVRLGVSYDEDVDSYTRQRSRRLSVMPRWAPNGHASLDLNYSLFARNTGENPRTEILLVTFTLTI